MAETMDCSSIIVPFGVQCTSYLIGLVVEATKGVGTAPTTPLAGL